MTPPVDAPPDPGVQTPTPPATGDRPPMNREMYELLDSVPDTYWRYVARHELFTALWRKHRTPKPPGHPYRVLDVGCGAGGLLAYLAKREPVQPVGIDLFPDTLPYCVRRGVRLVSAADATAMPFPDTAFDFVVAQDVVEHIEDDLKALREIRRVTAPGGLALILVPAYQSLWSARDVALRHFRRYRLGQLAGRVAAAGFEVVRRTYTDCSLMPPMWLAVRLAPKTPDGLANLSGEAAPGSKGLGRVVLLTVARAEGLVARHVPLPFGVSAVVLARRPT